MEQMFKNIASNAPNILVYDFVWALVLVLLQFSVCNIVRFFLVSSLMCLTLLCSPGSGNEFLGIFYYTVHD